MDEVKFVDRDLLRFMTIYEKCINGYIRTKDAFEMGDLVYHDGRVGVVVGYGKSNDETILYEIEGAGFKNGYFLRGTNWACDRPILNNICSKNHLSLLSKANNYLSQQLKIKHDHFKDCYKHYKLTGEFDFDNPLTSDDLNDLKRLEEEISDTKKKLSDLETRYNIIKNNY